MKYTAEISDETNYSGYNSRHGVSIDVKTCTSCGGRFIDLKKRKNRRRAWHEDLDMAVWIIAYTAALLGIVYVNEYTGGIILTVFLLLFLVFISVSLIAKMLKSEKIAANTEFDGSYEPVIPKPDTVMELVTVTKRGAKALDPEKVYRLITSEGEFYVLVTAIKFCEGTELYFKLNAEIKTGEAEIYDADNRCLGKGLLKTTEL